MKKKRIIAIFIVIAMTIIQFWVVEPSMAQDKPNILVIWGDDIGQTNVSAYTKGLMGYRTPNIDRVANEGMIFRKG
jgi:arylsulfatase